MDHIYDSNSSLWLHNELSGVWILEKNPYVFVMSVPS